VRETEGKTGNEKLVFADDFTVGTPGGTPVCGNCILDPGEQCDDGNVVSGDGCSANCTTEVCGNGILDPGEQCDDGNVVSGDGCSASCTIEECGNGILDPGEQCDDGNNIPGDGCSASCTIEECGNGILDPGEQCDDGNVVSGDGCSANCTTEVCGNGILDPGEECDDGNTAPGDGCSPTCTVEAPSPVDLDIRSFRSTNHIRLSRVKPVDITLVVRNSGAVDEPRPATVNGMQNGKQVYHEIMMVSDPAGNGQAQYNFPAFTPTAAGEIVWTATIDDDDPDLDTATATTKVVP
jgi:cysteine-rich repeat protein